MKGVPGVYFIACRYAKHYMNIYTLEQYCKIDVIDQGHIFMFQLFKQFCFIDIPSHKRFFIYRVSDIGYVHVHHVLNCPMYPDIKE